MPPMSIVNLKLNIKLPRKLSDEAQAFQKKWSKMVILAFACLGNLSGMATRLFPTGFYIEFLVERGLNKTIG